MIFSAIAAMAANRVIGVAGDLPWKIPEDFKFFKDKTRGRIIIMGRKTLESFPGGDPLPHRYHIVITRQTTFQPKKTRADSPIVIVDSVAAAVAEAKRECERNREKWGDEIFIIGGGEIYLQMLPFTDRIYLTEIHQDFAGETHFPEFSRREFVEVARSPRHEPVAFDFVTYERQTTSVM